MRNGFLQKRFVTIAFLLFAGLSLAAQNINFSEHIAPIIFNKCTPCHQAGQIAPMPFTNYEEVSAYASMIKYVTEIKYMPPWKTVNENHNYNGDRQLTNREIELIKEWVDGGLEKGDLGKLPPVESKHKKTTIENPDAVISMSESFEQYGVYYDQFRTFVLSTDFGQDKEIAAIEFAPGNASIVRSCFISVDNSDKVNALDEWDPGYGYFSFGEIGFVPDHSRWYTWQPLKGATIYPKDNGKILPKNAKLLLHIHYGPTGAPTKDSSYIKIKFSNKPLSTINQNIPLLHPYNLTNPPLKIPAGEKIRYHAKFEVPFDLTLSGIMPHSHLLGRKWEIFAVDPEGKNSQVLLKITDWDLKWKQQFDYEQPLQLQAGTIIHALAEYDNTSDNLLNPSDPPKSMQQGRRMFEEMFLVYFDLTIPTGLAETGIGLSSNSSLISSSKTTFNINVRNTQTVNATIKDFSGQTHLTLFQKKLFNNGEHKLNIDFENLPKGNYYLELTNQNGVVVGRSIFILVEESLFD